MIISLKRQMSILIKRNINRPKNYMKNCSLFLKAQKSLKNYIINMHIVLIIMKNYKDAENLFKGFLEVFPNSPKAEEIDYMHAYCFYKQSPKS